MLPPSSVALFFKTHYLVLKREFLKRIRLLYHLTTQIPLFSQVQILAHPAVFWANLRHNLKKDPLEAGGSVSCLQNSFDCLQSCCCCCCVVGWKNVDDIITDSFATLVVMLEDYLRHMLQLFRWVVDNL